MNKKQPEQNEKLSKSALIKSHTKRILDNVILDDIRRFIEDFAKNDVKVMRQKLCDIYGEFELSDTEKEKRINEGMEHYMSVRVTGSGKWWKSGEPDKFFARLENNESRDKILDEIKNKKPVETQFEK